MSQIAIWTALTVIGGLFLLIGVQAFIYAQDSIDTSMGNATNATTWRGNATNASSELDLSGKIATGRNGDGG